jgi:hypothetical protein
MLPGFKEGQEKMSKSDPSSTIFMEDDEVYISHEVFFLPRQHSFDALGSCDTLRCRVIVNMSYLSFD